MLTAEREVKAELLRMHHEVDSITVDLRQRPLVARQTTDEKVQSSYVHRIYLLPGRRSEASTKSNSIVSCDVPFLCEER